MKTKKTLRILHVMLLLFTISCNTDDDKTGIVSEIDTEVPVIQCLSNITVSISATETGIIVNFPKPIATDNISATVTQIKGISPGKIFLVGTTTNTFQAKDAAGNISVCSFDVIITRETPSLNMPYLIGNNPTPTGKKWVKMEDLSDEFEGTSISSNWDTRSVVPGRFNWLGRFPGLFQVENMSVVDGELRMEAKKEVEPINLSNKDWTHTGAIIRSNAFVKPGMFIEAKMKTTTTIMSGTFWIQAPSSDCTILPKTELDVTESIGRSSGKFKPTEPGEEVPTWYANAREDFLQGMNATARERTSACTSKAVNRGTPSDKGGTFSPSEDFHVYGFHWEDPTKLHFYIDGIYSHSIVPSIPFNTPMAIIMAIETYDFNWPNDAEADGFNESKIDRSTRYKWVRTWNLEDE
ncbi:HYR domain-containing protein [Flavicella sediminum]|uniref:HYR domain-containing protein n=1 Tax=Flavicella sediminum TaxID=2585141 RepID=UPI001120B379|nr:HYR domain-containing protein [Flavicella sediminum]